MIKRKTLIRLLKYRGFSCPLFSIQGVNEKMTTFNYTYYHLYLASMAGELRRVHANIQKLIQLWMCWPQELSRGSRGTGCEAWCLMGIKPWSFHTTKAPWQGECVGGTSLSVMLCRASQCSVCAIINTSAVVSNFKLYNWLSKDTCLSSVFKTRCWII